MRELGVERKIHIHDKYIITPEFNKLTVENLAAILKQADSVKKTDFENKLASLTNKLLQMNQKI